MTNSTQHQPATSYLSDGEIDLAHRAAQRQNETYRLHKGFTATEVATEARANIHYFAEQLAQAEALLALTAAETAIAPR